MGDNKSSADVKALFRYADEAQRINGLLGNEAKKLAAALEAFAKTCTEYSTGVGPGLAGELRAYVSRTAPTDTWVRKVGKDFAQADADFIKDGPGNIATNVTNFSQGHLALEEGKQMALHTRYSTTRQAENIRKSRWLAASYQAWKATPRGEELYIKSNRLSQSLGHLSKQKMAPYTKGAMPWRQIGHLTKDNARDALLPKHKLFKKLWVVQLGVGAAQNWQEFQGQENRAAKTAAATAFDTAVQTGINVAATAAGTAAGGALGGALGGPIGAAIGARLGGLAGSMAGAWVSEKVMETDAVKDVRESVVSWLAG